MGAGMNWSHYQSTIFDAFENTSDSLLIEAVAGSGKTTCLVELARIMRERMPELRGCFLAFNKSIATTLQERIGSGGNVVAMTLHSAGWAAWRRAGGLDWTPRLETAKVGNIIREMMTWEERKKWEESTRKLVGFAKGVGLVPLLDGPDCHRCERLYTHKPAGRGHHPECGWSEHGELSGYRGLVQDAMTTWDALIEHYGLDPDECSVPWARKVLARSIEISHDVCDYDDMLMMPVIAGVPFEHYDVVLVDETQDVSGIQMEMIGRMTAREHAGGPDRPDTPPVFLLEQNHPKYRPRPRVIAVGDRNQAIYGFRGAGTDSMDLMKARFGMRELPLSVSYRCPISVVQHARQWVPQIEWRDDAPDGAVFGEETDWAGQAGIALGAPSEEARPAMGEPLGDRWVRNLEARPMSSWTADEMRTYNNLTGQGEGISKWRGISDFLPGDAILCRLTRPLIEAAFALVRSRIACRVLGRDIGAGLIALVKKPKFALDRPVSDWEAWAERWLGEQRERLTAKRQFAALGNLEDRVETIRIFIDEVNLPYRMDRRAPLGELIQAIESVFKDKGPEGMVTLATCHKAKGLEWPRVFILDAGKYMPVPWGRGGGWESVQEVNCMYIAATRAIRELRYIKSETIGIADRRR